MKTNVGLIRRACFAIRNVSRVLAFSVAAVAAVGASEPLTSPVEVISVRKEVNREVCILGQRAQEGRMKLTPDSCLFYGALRLTGLVPATLPGAELNGNKSFTRIEGLGRAGTRVVWPLWLPETATLKFSVFMEVPTNVAGTTLEFSLGEARRTLVTHASTGLAPQPATIELAVSKPGLHELSVSVPGQTTGENVGALLRITVEGSGLGKAALVRTRWRAAAIHAGFRSSELETNNAQSRLWVMEARPLPCEDSMYAPITTPFGYFGSTFNPDGTSGGINFSMWSYAAGKAEPPIEQLSHLLALGDPRQEFGGFGHEGTGVKPRGWNPFEGQKLKSVVLALRLEPGDPYDTYTGYFYDRPSQQWKLYASGRKWHTPKRGRESLLPGSFVEVPGPPDRERSAHIPRGVDFRGWCRGEKGDWHPIDQMTANEIRAGEPVQKAHQLSSDGWFRMVMGGLEQYRYAESKPVIQSKSNQPLPDYMDSSRLAVLDRMPASVKTEDVRRAGDLVQMKVRISIPSGTGRLTAYYGSKDTQTFADRWEQSKDLGEFSTGAHTVQIPASKSSGACRLLLRGPFGSVWSDEPAKYPASK